MQAKIIVFRVAHRVLLRRCQVWSLKSAVKKDLGLVPGSIFAKDLGELLSTWANNLGSDGPTVPV